MIAVTVNAEQFARQLDDVARQQVPFALSLTLTRSAEEAVREQIADLPARFHIRNSWVAKGFRVKPARKTDLTAIIRHKDSYMFLQEHGGVKRPAAAPSVAIPHGATFAGARGSIERTTPRSKWPGRVKRKVYITKGDTVYEYARTGRRGKRRVHHAAAGAGTKRGPGFRDPALKLMYVMKRSVRVRPRLGMERLVRRVVGERAPVNFRGFLEFAVRTRKT